MSPNEVATYVIDYAHKTEKSVTPMKLQKLLFYIKAWGLVADVDIIPAAFRKWAFGPVNPNVYRKYEEYGSGPIPPPEKVHSPCDDQRMIIDFVLSSYAQFSAVELSNMTHSEAPWKEAEANSRISEDSILDYYKKQPFANNFPLATSTSYRPPTSQIGTALLLDIDLPARESLQTFCSKEEFDKAVEDGFESIEKWLKTQANHES